jgi:hypothetical protein
MTLAAIDRLVRHATILEMNVESYRRRAAIERKRAPARQAIARATTEAGNRGDQPQGNRGPKQQGGSASPEELKSCVE